MPRKPRDENAGVQVFRTAQRTSLAVRVAMLNERIAGGLRRAIRLDTKR
jgi:hypothetical protein